MMSPAEIFCGTHHMRFFFCRYAHHIIVVALRRPASVTRKQRPCRFRRHHRAGRFAHSPATEGQLVDASPSVLHDAGAHCWAATLAGRLPPLMTRLMLADAAHTRRTRKRRWRRIIASSLRALPALHDRSMTYFDYYAFTQVSGRHVLEGVIYGQSCDNCFLMMRRAYIIRAHFQILSFRRCRHTLSAPPD